MPESVTVEELLEEATESLCQGLSLSPIDQPLGFYPPNLPALTCFDHAGSIAGKAIYETRRQKRPEEKATAMVIMAIVNSKLGLRECSSAQVRKATELTSEAFVDGLMSTIVARSAAITTDSLK